MSNAELFETYLTRFTSGDAEGAAELLADDFTFDGPMLQAGSKAEFLAGAGTAAAMARGFKMHQQWTDADTVCSVYDFEIETPAGGGSVPMAEWSVIRDGKLVASHLIFDTAAMAALMPVA
jgi:ketosteroid isomerase-like protein